MAWNSMRMFAAGAAVTLLPLHGVDAGLALPTDGKQEIEWSAEGSPPLLGLPPGKVVTVSFRDATGEPWPVSELAGADVPWLRVRRAASHPHVAILEAEAGARTAAGDANLVALLTGLPTPVHLALAPDGAEAPTAVAVRIPESRSGDAPPGAPAEPHGADFDAAVREYLLANPQVLREALDPRRQLASRVSEHRQELLGAPGVPALGDLSGGVTVVEFFDYRCGYCKRSLDAVRGVLEKAGVRLEMREYPILGEGSVLAARAALAAARQGAYEAAHFALMAHEGGFDAGAVDSIMDGLGLDMERLAADMASEAVGALIGANRELAARLGVTGTPAFLVVGPGGVEVSPGAVDADRLAGMIDAAG